MPTSCLFYLKIVQLRHNPLQIMLQLQVGLHLLKKLIAKGIFQDIEDEQHRIIARK